MPRVIVDVMLKPEILDPQGKAVRAALTRLGYTGVADVRQGKRFELTLAEDPTAEALDAIGQAAATLLANPVIEDVVSIRLEAGSAPVPHPGSTPVLDQAQ
ncbi:MAG: phosphoribosylformylglycinamidine synthase subunit PurS [Coriobacteriales bacterium]|jgi:phosphoribosylformylglycinamidine synthase|nr:phosphoribosylformylglycinamidine synthase subunit PurS [Coriobacteriales bacterium]